PLIKEPVAEDIQHALNNIPATMDEVLSQPVPAQVDLQSKAIQQSIKETSITGWIIQVGSFSQEKNALEFRDKLRKNKFTAYVDSTTTAKHGTLYRLRVGPELDEKRALKTKQMLESQYRVKTLLVSE
ncbi:MAG: SPOR domain-containing protein, partial [Methyloprofundus sp.]|nr:SPOR domain-containing protein [Methyloprofundus sp.]